MSDPKKRVLGESVIYDGELYKVEKVYEGTDVYFVGNGDSFVELVSGQQLQDPPKEPHE